LIALFADNLPAGALLDQAAGLLVWTPAAGQAGLYRNVVIGVTDGKATTVRSFDISVSPSDFAPVVAQPAPQSIREGDLLRVQLDGFDPEGKVLSFYSPFLPANASLHPSTGLFQWTPGYTQAGNYEIPILVSDGSRTSTITLVVNV